MTSREPQPPREIEMEKQLDYIKGVATSMKKERLKRIKEKTRNNTTIGIFFIMTWEDYIALKIHSVSYSHLLHMPHSYWITN